jgi:hypothetical protein
MLTKKQWRRCTAKHSLRECKVNRLVISTELKILIPHDTAVLFSLYMSETIPHVQGEMYQVEKGHVLVHKGTSNFFLLLNGKMLKAKQISISWRIAK